MLRDRMPRAVALLALFIVSFIAGANYTPTTTTDLYVDCANGVDAAPSITNLFTPACTDSAHPCLTPQFAANQFPRVVNGQFTMHIGVTDGGAQKCTADFAADAGAQATLELDALSVDGSVNPNAALVISCSTKQLLADTTVTSFASATSTSQPTVTVAGAGWTNNAYKDAFFAATSGTGAGQTCPIVKNTSTTIALASGCGSFNATTHFHIIAPAVSIIDGTLASPNTSAVPSALGLVNTKGGTRYRGTSYSYTWGVRVVNCDISGQIIGVQASAASGVQFINSTVEGTGFDAVEWFSGTEVQFTGSVLNGGTGNALDVYSYADNLTQGNGIISKSVLHGGVGVNANYAKLQIDAAYTDAAVGFQSFAASNFRVSSSSVEQTAGGVAFVAQDSASSVFISGGQQYGSTPLAYATLNSGDSISFSVAVATTATNFVSLDNGSTYVTKATIEAATNKTIFNTSTGALAKEQ